MLQEKIKQMSIRLNESLEGMQKEFYEFKTKHFTGVDEHLEEEERNKKIWTRFVIHIKKRITSANRSKAESFCGYILGVSKLKQWDRKRREEIERLYKEDRDEAFNNGSVKQVKLVDGNYRTRYFNLEDEKIVVVENDKTVLNERGQLISDAILIGDSGLNSIIPLDNDRERGKEDNKFKNWQFQHPLGSENYERQVFGIGFKLDNVPKTLEEAKERTEMFMLTLKGIKMSSMELPMNVPIRFKGIDKTKEGSEGLIIGGSKAQTTFVVDESLSGTLLDSIENYPPSIYYEFVVLFNSLGNYLNRYDKYTPVVTKGIVGDLIMEHTQYSDGLLILDDGDDSFMETEADPTPPTSCYLPEWVNIDFPTYSEVQIVGTLSRRKDDENGNAGNLTMNVWGVYSQNKIVEDIREVRIEKNIQNVSNLTLDSIESYMTNEGAPIEKVIVNTIGLSENNNINEEVVKEAINILMNEGKIYESTQGHLKSMNVEHVHMITTGIDHHVKKEEEW